MQKIVNLALRSSYEGLVELWWFCSLVSDQGSYGEWLRRWRLVEFLRLQLNLICVQHERRGK